LPGVLRFPRRISPGHPCGRWAKRHWGNRDDFATDGTLGDPAWATAEQGERKGCRTRRRPPVCLLDWTSIATPSRHAEWCSRRVPCRTLPQRQIDHSM